MLLYTTILHYVLLVILLWQAISLLRKQRGNSLLAIFSIAIALQIGGGWAYYVYVAVPSGDLFSSISDEALQRMAISLCITSAIFIMAIILFKARMPRMRSMASDNLMLSKEMVMILGICTLVFVGFLLMSPASRYVIEHGSDVVGSESYYQVRGELIQVGTDHQSGRLEHRFMRLSYAILLLSGLVFLYKFSITRRWQFLAFGIFFASVPVLQALLSFQKGPIVTIFCILIATLILFYRKEGMVRMRLWGAVVACTIAGIMAAMSFIIFQGVGFGDAGRNVLRRIFVVPVHGTAMHHAVYPDYHPYVKFGDIGTIRQFSPIGVGHVPMYGSMAREVAMTLHGLDYNANTGLIGHGWGTWGHWGVVMFAVMVASFFSLIDRFTAKRRHLASVAPLIIYYWFFFMNYGNTNLHNLMSTSSLFILPFLYFRIFWNKEASASVRPEGVELPSPPPARFKHPHIRKSGVSSFQ